MGKEIEIVFNGMTERVFEETTVSGLIAKVGEKDGGLIVEVNNRFVFPQKYSSTVLVQGDKVEFINPDFGG